MSRPYQPGDRVRGLLDLCRPGARTGGVDHAMGKVSLEQAQGHGLQRPGGGRDLGQHVDAVRVLFHHAVQATDLTLNPLEASQQSLLLGAVPVLVALLARHAPTVPLPGIYPVRAVSPRTRCATGRPATVAQWLRRWSASAAEGGEYVDSSQSFQLRMVDPGPVICDVGGRLSPWHHARLEGAAVRRPPAEATSGLRHAGPWGRRHLAVSG